MILTFDLASLWNFSKAFILFLTIISKEIKAEN